MLLRTVQFIIETVAVEDKETPIELYSIRVFMIMLVEELTMPVVELNPT